jgi:hypothetical protein
MLQERPFHRCARVSEVPRLLLVLPTAMQAERDTQDTAFRLPPAAPGGLGVGWMLQALPFHRSASVAGAGWLTSCRWFGVEKPTAVHPVAEVHATPRSRLTTPPGMRVGWMLHVWPFHRSAKDRDSQIGDVQAWNAPVESL